MRICNAEIYKNGKFVIGDIEICGERILTIGEDIKTGTANTLDAEGLLAIPGLVDMMR